MEKILVTRSSMPDYEEYIEAIKPLWESHCLTNMGIYHQKLESSLMDYLKVPFVSLFTNGHMALELAIQAMELKGEVITSPFTFASTTHAIVRNGLTPVFCDIDPVNYTMDPEKIESLITENTSAILPVHVYGNICEVKKIEEIAKRHNLKVIYDAAHAFGVEYAGKGIGTYGDASMFSFHATKVFNTIEGGAICFKDDTLGKKMYQLKNFGIRNEEIVDGVGSNAKMNEFQAIMGICNLKHLDCEIHKRKKLVEIYTNYFKDIEGITISKIPQNVKSNYAYFPIMINEKICGCSRDYLYEALKARGIFARKYFYPITSSFDCYRGRFRIADTPVALKVSQRVLTLPLYADLEVSSVEEISSVVRKCCDKREG